MALIYTDAYLKTRITPDIERRALADVDNLGAFPSSPINWREKLGVLRAYIIACLELGGSPGDMFESKLKQYNPEFDKQLALARQAATAADSDNYVPFLSIPIERA